MSWSLPLTDRHSIQVGAQRRREMEPRFGFSTRVRLIFLTQLNPDAVGTFRHGAQTATRALAGFQLAPALRSDLAGMTVEVI